MERMSSGRIPTGPEDVNGLLCIERGVLNRWDLVSIGDASQCHSLRSRKLPFRIHGKSFGLGTRRQSEC